MRVVSIDEPHWDVERPEPHRLRAARVGAQAGAQAIGATLYELAPGGAVSAYHLHHANEELLIVLAGRPRLRTPEGTVTLETGSVVAFPPGEEGAHRISNRGPEPARVLVCSTMNTPDIAEYTDTGTWLAVTSRAEGSGRPEGRAFPGGSEVPIADAIAQGMEEGAAREPE